MSRSRRRINRCVSSQITCERLVRLRGTRQSQFVSQARWPVASTSSAISGLNGVKKREFPLCRGEEGISRMIHGRTVTRSASERRRPGVQGFNANGVASHSPGLRSYPGFCREVPPSTPTGLRPGRHPPRRNPVGVRNTWAATRKPTLTSEYEGWHWMRNAARPAVATGASVGPSPATTPANACIRWPAMKGIFRSKVSLM